MQRARAPLYYCDIKSTSRLPTALGRQRKFMATLANFRFRPGAAAQLYSEILEGHGPLVRVSIVQAKHANVTQQLYSLVVFERPFGNSPAFG
jgi:hypothetical protein